MRIHIKGKNLLIFYWTNIGGNILASKNTTVLIRPTIHNRHSDASLRKKTTIHQVTAMLATFKNGLFPGHNHVITTGTDNMTL